MTHRSSCDQSCRDGPLSGGLAGWEGYGDLFPALVRWTAGAGAPDALFATARREGAEGVIELEAAAGAEGLLGRAEARALDDAGRARPIALRRDGPRRLTGRLPLRSDTLYRPIVTVGEDVALRLPPLVLPVAPELTPPRDPREGERALRRLARRTGGALDPQAAALLDGSRRGRGIHDLAPPLAALAVLLLLLEIAVRRLGLQVPAALPAALRRRSASTAIAPERPAGPTDMAAVLQRARERARRRQ